MYVESIFSPLLLQCRVLFNYKEIENYMNDANSVDKATGEKIKKLHDNNQHKFNTPTYRRND